MVTLLLIGALGLVLPAKVVFEYSIDLDRLSIFEPDRMAVSSGDIFILEKTTTTVYRIRKGKLLNTFGKKGSGPGYLMDPVNIGVYRNLIWVTNATGRVDLFDFEGNYQKSFTESLKELSFSALVKIYDNGIKVVIDIDYDRKGNSIHSYKLITTSQEKTLLSWRTNLIRMFREVLFNTRPMVACGREFVFLLKNKKTFRIDAYSISRMACTGVLVDDSYSPVPPSTEVVKSYKEKVAKIEKETGEDKLVSNIPYPDRANMIEMIYADEKDNLYLQLNEREGAKVRVAKYNQQLEYQCDFFILEPEFMVVSEGKMYVKREATDAYVIDVYSIE